MESVLVRVRVIDVDSEDWGLGMGTMRKGENDDLQLEDWMDVVQEDGRDRSGRDCGVPSGGFGRVWLPQPLWPLSVRRSQIHLETIKSISLDLSAELVSSPGHLAYV